MVETPVQGGYEDSLADLGGIFLAESSVLDPQLLLLIKSILNWLYDKNIRKLYVHFLII